MWIELDYTPDLDTDEIHSFIIDSDPSNTTYTSKVISEAGMTPVARRPREKGMLLGPLYAFIKEIYAIERDRKGVGRQEIIVPIEQGMTLVIVNTLFLRDDIVETDKQAIIEKVFIDFDASKDDPYDYARKALPADITDEMFMVRPSFELVKSGVREERKEQRIALFELYQGKSAGSIDLPIGVDGIGDYFDRGNYTVILLSVEPCRVGQPEKDPNILESDSVEDDPSPIIDELVREETKVLDCGQIEVVKQRVATLLQWPEFKVEWEPKRVKIGCVRITIRLPVLYIRTTKLALYYFYGKIQNLGILIEKIIETCALRGILAGAIIGVALSNLQAAIVAFRTVFVECIKSQAQQAIVCLIPGLLIIKEKGGWHRA